MSDRYDDPDTTIETPEGAVDSELTADGAETSGGVGVRREQEAEILRGELTRVQAELAAVRKELEDAKQRHLRARADLENYRRRVTGDLELAREAGLDAAVLPVLTVFDDLGRALQAAQSSEDPAAIVPGVRSVLESLERGLETLDIRAIGAPGEVFDPDVHEALSAIPATELGQGGTIADVFQAGFKRGGRLVRPARVVVYQERN